MLCIDPLITQMSPFRLVVFALFISFQGAYLGFELKSSHTRTILASALTRFEGIDIDAAINS